MQTFQVTRRNLPHWQEPGSVYFLTWRCRDGELLAAEEPTIALDAILYWNGHKWRVYVAVIMADHVHLLAQPLRSPQGGAFGLAEMLHSVKRFSTQRINQLRGGKGSIWQDERYDRIVRDDAEFLEKWNYIRHNPVKVGLAEHPEDYPWLYERGQAKGHR